MSDLPDFARLLDLLGVQADEVINVCYRDTAGQFRADFPTRARHAPDTAADHPGTDVWFSPCPLRDDFAGPGRGGAADRTRLTALFTDIDVKDGAAGSMAVADALVARLEAIYGEPATAVVETGGGLHAYWRITDGDRPDAADVLRRHGYLVNGLHAELGAGRVDSVHDMARVLRVPGTVNVKQQPARPVLLRSREPGEPLSLDEVIDAMNRYGTPEVHQRGEALPVPQADWQPAERTCGYVRAMVEAWASEEVKADRHNWLGAQAVRLSCALRLGCITHEDFEAAQNVLWERFLHMLSNPLRGQQRREPGAGDRSFLFTDWASDAASVKSEQECRRELGDHEHGIEFIEASPALVAGRPGLNVTNAATASDELRAAIGRGPTSSLFQRGGKVVLVPQVGEDGYRRLTKDADDVDSPAHVLPVTPARLSSTLDASYFVHAWKPSRVHGRNRDVTEFEQVHVLVQETVVSRIAAAPELLPNLRTIHGVVHTPVLRSDMSVLDEPGYDDQSGLLFLPAKGMDGLAVPERPTATHVEQARALLLEVVSGFPFVSDGDRANFLAAWLGPMIRRALPAGSMLPLLAINSPSQGTGKTKLANVLIGTHGGVLRVRIPDHEEELRKQVSTILGVTTGGVVVFDNVMGTITSGTLSGLITTATWTDRALGSNVDIKAPNDRLWVVTGNNLSIGGDNARRTFWVTIDADTPQPWRRDGFAIPDLDAHIAANKPAIVAALLTLVRHWVSLGCPTTSTGRQDNFSAFAAAAQGIVEAAGVAGSVMGADTDRGDNGSEEDDWALLLAAIHGWRGEVGWKVGDLLAHAQSFSGADVKEHLPLQVIEKLDRSSASAAASLGMYLRYREGRWHVLGDEAYTARSLAGSGKTSRTWRVHQRGGQASRA